MPFFIKLCLSIHTFIFTSVSVWRTVGVHTPKYLTVLSFVYTSDHIILSVFILQLILRVETLVPVPQSVPCEGYLHLRSS